MIRGHIIELKPNNVQANHLARACGAARKPTTGFA
ncbi:helix-turn-helix domain-containing protein [Psychrobacter submarinus]|nr:helix-turn-helix domain-containing protein [Psychrobacter submarinus]